MAQWKETSEPYVRVKEVVKTRVLAPTAGEDLIIGCVVISDSGPTTPTLIQDQMEFIKVFSRYTTTDEITEEYIKSLDELYTGEMKNVASTMWQNGFRLAGSNNILVVRASKGKDTLYTKDFDGTEYVIKEGTILKKVPSFKLVLDVNNPNGFAVNVNGIGIFGNLTTEEGPVYDYQVNNLKELVDALNDTPKFFSPYFEYFGDDKGEVKVEQEEDAVSVVFKEVYLAKDFLNQDGNLIIDGWNEKYPNTVGGLYYLIPTEIEWKVDNKNQGVYDLNSEKFSGFDEPKFYAINKYNTAAPTKIRIRRFNHDAVTSKPKVNASNLYSGGADSPYNVIESILDTYTNGGTKEPAKSVLDRDFFEIAVLDSGVDAKNITYMNVGNIPGYGDLTVKYVKSALEMIGVELPEDLHELGLNYYGYNTDDTVWKKIGEIEDVGAESDYTMSENDPDNKILLHNTKVIGKEIEEAYDGLTYEDLYDEGIVPRPDKGGVVRVNSGNNTGYFEYSSNGYESAFIDLTINTKNNHIISVNESDMLNAIESITLDEVYTTEGLCDLGNTTAGFQKRMASAAIGSNYFYPISTVDSSNYYAIGSSITSTFGNMDSMKLYALAPWDLSSSTFSWDCKISPSVLYWETVARNRSVNEEFRGAFGQKGGIANYDSPVAQFNTSSRQLLLSKKVNCVKWDPQVSRWLINDNYTKQSFDTIMSDEGNSRLMIRISKAVPTLLKPFIGEKITDKLCKEVEDAIHLFFKQVILAMGYTVDAYEVKCKFNENLAAQNKIKVIINVRYQRSLKYVEVVNNAYDVGMDINDFEE